MKVKDVKNIYQNWYSEEVQSNYEGILAGWRRLGAIHKAKNISKVFQPKPTSVVLDIGGGMGDVSEVLFQEFSFPPTTLLEISKDGVNISANKHGVREAIEFDGYNIPLPDRSVDFGFATHVLEHVPDPRRFLREAHRVCNKLFIEVPIDYSQNINTKHLLSYGHINVFTPSTVRFLIESEGFFVEQEFSSNTQRRFDLKYYNHFLNGGAPANLYSKSKFIAKHFASQVKGFFVNRFPSECCFLLVPDDDFDFTIISEISN